MSERRGALGLTKAHEDGNTARYESVCSSHFVFDDLVAPEKIGSDEWTVGDELGSEWTIVSLCVDNLDQLVAPLPLQVLHGAKHIGHPAAFEIRARQKLVITVRQPAGRPWPPFIAAVGRFVGEDYCTPKPVMGSW